MTDPTPALRAYLAALLAEARGINGDVSHVALDMTQFAHGSVMVSISMALGDHQTPIVEACSHSVSAAHLGALAQLRERPKKMTDAEIDATLGIVRAA